MPIYEYQCQDCQTRFEMIRPMKDADSEAGCTECHSKNTKRRISLFNASSEGHSISGGSNCSGCIGGSCNTCGSN